MYSLRRVVDFYTKWFYMNNYAIFYFLINTRDIWEVIFPHFINEMLPELKWNVQDRMLSWMWSDTFTHFSLVSKSYCRIRKASSFVPVSSTLFSFLTRTLSNIYIKFKICIMFSRDRTGLSPFACAMTFKNNSAARWGSHLCIVVICRFLVGRDSALIWLRYLRGFMVKILPPSILFLGYSGSSSLVHSCIICILSESLLNFCCLFTLWYLLTAMTNSQGVDKHWFA